MYTTTSGSTALSGKGSWKKALFMCGIISSIFYAAMNIFAAVLYDGYNSASQTVSELSAIDAPTRPLWISMVIVYTLLVIAFGSGVWLSAGRDRSLRIAGNLMIANVIFGLFWPPMHQREVLASGGGTLTDTLHIVWALVTVPLMLLIVWFGSAAFGKPFRFYSIVTIAVMLVFGALTGLVSPLMEANLATPWMGVWERISIGAYMLWVIVFAIKMWGREKSMASAGATKNSKLRQDIAGRRPLHKLKQTA